MRAGYRTRILVFLFCVFLVVVVLPVSWQFVGTLRQLDRIETDRDQWQRPNDVLAALDLHAGSRVVDLGCGSGYFALRVSPAVGPDGEVMAEDIRALSLIFLRTRAFLRHDRNIRIIRGTPNDPRLPDNSADAVLIANTYHELDQPGIILAAIHRALRPAGRLVVLDRGPPTGTRESGRHHIPESVAEDEVRRAGFDPIRRNDPFIQRPDDDPWWLLVARKP